LLQKLAGAQDQEGIVVGHSHQPVGDGEESLERGWEKSATTMRRWAMVSSVEGTGSEE
jgi:hypothetical protein